MFGKACKVFQQDKGDVGVFYERADSLVSALSFMVQADDEASNNFKTVCIDVLYGFSERIFEVLVLACCFEDFLFEDSIPMKTGPKFAAVIKSISSRSCPKSTEACVQNEKGSPWAFIHGSVPSGARGLVACFQ